MSSSRSSKSLKQEAFRLLGIMAGAVIAAVGLEFFLVPNDFMDGGIVGISIILSRFMPLPLGFFIGLLNLPFVLLAFRFLGKRAAVKTAVGVGTLTGATLLMAHQEAWTHEFVLALGYGGLLLGLGTGLALRYGGALDGVEALSVIISQKTRYNVDQIILMANLVIFAVAAALISLESAMASLLLFYMVVTPIIRKTMEAGNEYKTAQIITTNAEPVVEAIHETMNRRIMVSDSVKSEKKGEVVTNTFSEVSVLTVIISRIEEATLLDLMDELDPDALVIVSDTQSIYGGVFRNRSHH